MTHPGIFVHPLDPERAVAAIGQLQQAQSARIVGEGNNFWNAYQAITIGRPIRGNDVPDAAVVAMVMANGVSTIHTRDRGFRRSTESAPSTPLPEPPGHRPVK